jgi:predicted AAA+ superfamily ATPase
LTGSNNDLLSSEIASGLRWKATSFEILPLDFQEVLDFKGVLYDSFPSTIKLINYKQILNEILVWWSFPEIVKIPEIDDKLRILEDYLEIMTFKDVIERFNLKSIKKIRYFEKLVISYMWEFINLKKISQQVWADYNSILNWMEYFAQAYLWFEVKNFDFSIWRQQKSQSKIYILDNGYYSVNFYHYKEDLWKLFENWVFMEFKKLGLKENKNIFYFKNWGFDIDFVVVNKQKFYFIQVVYELNKKNYAREVEQLLKLKEEYPDIVPVVIYKDNLMDTLPENIIFVPFYNLKNFIYG